jgi:hypothetical protein
VLALGCGVVAAGGLILLTTERIGRTAGRPAPVPVEAAGGEQGGAAPGPAAEVPAAEALDAVPQQRPTVENTRTAPVAGASGTVMADADAGAGPGAGADDVADGEVDAGVERLLDDVRGRPVPDGVPPGAADGRRVVDSCLPASYVPFPSGVAVPLPVLDRHRTRVRS